MMHSTFNVGTGTGLFFGLHMVFMLAFAVGILFLLFWAFKNLNQKDLWKWGWILVAIGIIGCVLTLSLLSFHSSGTDVRFGMMGQKGLPMMRGNAIVNTVQDDGSQAKEEAEGKALYDKLQSKQTTCADLSDSDFELIGEYVMGQKLGDSHLQMNDTIKQMMGTQGEEQMHIFLGKSQTGCATEAQSSTR